MATAKIHYTDAPWHITCDKCQAAWRGFRTEAETTAFAAAHDAKLHDGEVTA